MPARSGPGVSWAVLGAVSAGGALGALARYGALLAWPAPAGGFPWALFGVNVLGSGLIGALMVLVAENGRDRWAPPLARPFLGVGVLGGFTSFSTYAMDVSGLLAGGEPVKATAYALGTVGGALGGVWAAAAVTRRALGRRGGGVAGGRAA
nr:CrcB family protein [Streptomyces candidus]